MTPYRRTGSRCWYLTLTLRDGSYDRPSSATHDYETAKGMQGMLAALSRRGSRDWDLVDAIAARRVRVGAVYDAWLANDLAGLRARLADVDLGAEIDAWEQKVTQELAPETVRKYVAQVARIFPRDDEGNRIPVLRSAVTRQWLKRELAAVPGSNTNRARHAAAWMSVLDHLVEADLLERNPLRDVSVPVQSASRTPHITRLEDVIRLVEAMPAGLHRVMAALREGAGLEVQAVLAMRARDIVDTRNRIVWAHGRKSEYRDRQVVVDPWAWAYVRRYLAAGGFLPDAMLFPVTHREHRDDHTAACERLREQGIAIPKGYTPHCCRNTYAIRNMRANVDAVLTANNLGHADTRMVLSKYGRFRPAVTDIVRADRRTGRRHG